MLKRLQNSGTTKDEPDDQADEQVRQTAGQFLNEKRAEFGYDLRHVSEQLRIRHVYLVAIEEDRLDDLPGATYAVGFVRAYAEFLGLNGPEIVERFKEETEELAKSAHLVFPSPQSEGKIPSGVILLMSVIVMALVYGGWVFLSSKDRPIAELVPALPESFLELIGQGKDATEPRSEAEPAQSPSPVTQNQLATNTPASMPAAPAPQPEMPAVTPAPLKPVTVDTSPAPVPPVTETEPTQPPVTSAEPETPAVAAAEQVATITDNAQSVNEAAETAVGNAAPLVSASVPAQPEEPITQTLESSVPAAAEMARASSDAAVIDVPDSASETAERTVASTLPSAPAETAVPATAISDGSPPVTADSDNDSAQVDGNVIAALSGPPAPPAIGADSPRVYGTENADFRVVLRASEDVWVQVRDEAGNLLLTRLLRKGDAYRAPNDSGLIMRTGNAGGLEILVDGAVIPRIGSKGIVLNDVALDADLLKAGTATSR